MSMALPAQPFNLPYDAVFLHPNPSNAMAKSTPRIEDPIKAQDAKLRKVSAAAAAADSQAIAINDQSQLFLDDHLIQSRASLHRRINQPTKLGDPFLVHDREWEGQAVIYGSLLEPSDDAPHFRLYYKGWNKNNRDKKPWTNWPICLATSDDGVIFKKNKLKSSPVPGTNIVISDNIDDFNILRDPAPADLTQRYKLLASRGNWWAGLTPACSSDGLTWTWGKDHAVSYFGDRCSYWYDPVQKQHVAWSRNYQIHPNRILVESRSDDFVSWKHPHIALMPDRLDHPMVQFYGGYGFWYRSLYIAYVEVYHIQHLRLDVQLACSRDGKTWHRLCDNDTFMPNGPHGSFDAYWIVPTFNPPVPSGDRLLIHYNGRPDPHSIAGMTHVPPGMGGAFGLSVLREDGFASLDSVGTPSTLLTKLLKIPAGARNLQVNACPFNARPGYPPMDLLVEILDPQDRVLMSGKIRTHEADKVWHALRLPVRLPAELRLRFSSTNTRLYSFRFAV